MKSRKPLAPRTKPEPILVIATCVGCIFTTLVLALGVSHAIPPITTLGLLALNTLAMLACLLAYLFRKRHSREL